MSADEALPLGKGSAAPGGYTQWQQNHRHGAVHKVQAARTLPPMSADEALPLGKGSAAPGVQLISTFAPVPVSSPI